MGPAGKGRQSEKIGSSSEEIRQLAGLCGREIHWADARHVTSGTRLPWRGAVAASWRKMVAMVGKTQQEGEETDEEMRASTKAVAGGRGDGTMVERAGFRGVGARANLHFENVESCAQNSA